METELTRTRAHRSQGRELCSCFLAKCVHHRALTLAPPLTALLVIAVNPQGTVPALVVPYAHTVEEGITTKFKAINSTIEICDFLDRSTVRSAHHSAPVLSPATVQRSAVSKEIIEHVHRDDVNPNTLLLLWRSDEERQAKLGGMVGGFLKGRQEALERYAKEVGDSDAKLKEFYAGKVKENGGLLALLEGKGESSDIQKKAHELWTNVGKALEFLESRFEPAAPFLVGDQVSLAECVLDLSFPRLLSLTSSCLLQPPRWWLARARPRLCRRDLARRRRLEPPDARVEPERRQDWTEDGGVGQGAVCAGQLQAGVR